MRRGIETSRSRSVAVRMARNRTVRIPAVVAHVNHAGAPVKPAGTPSPFAIPCTKPNTGAIADIGGIAVGADVVDNTGIVHRHVDIFGTGRLDDNRRIHSHRHLLVRLQVSIIVGLVTQALHGIENGLFLSRNRITQLVGPGRVLGHHVKDRRERD